MLAAALPFVGGFGVGGCAYALRLQNDCFVWLCAPVSAPRPRGRCARLRRLALRSVRGAAAVGVRTAAAATYLSVPFVFFCLSLLTTATIYAIVGMRRQGEAFAPFYQT